MLTERTGEDWTSGQEPLPGSELHSLLIFYTKMSIYTVAVFYPSETNVFLFQYEPPSKEVQEKQMESVKRVRERQAQQRTA